MRHMTDTEVQAAYDARVGRNILTLRLARGLTQGRLAELLEHHGVTLSQPVLVKVEQGRRPLRLREAHALAAVLGVRVDEVVAEKQPDTLLRALEWVRLAQVFADEATRVSQELATVRNALVELVEHPLRDPLPPTVEGQVFDAIQHLGDALELVLRALDKGEVDG